jgi:hypothetical protein
MSLSLTRTLIPWPRIDASHARCSLPELETVLTLHSAQALQSLFRSPDVGLNGTVNRGGNITSRQKGNKIDTS